MAPTNTTQSSPNKLTEFGRAKHAAIEESLPANKKNLRKEMSAYYSGPIPAQDFIEEFLPANADLPEELLNSINYNTGITVHTKREDQMYKPFIDAVNKNGLMPGYILVNISNSGEDETGSKPDVGAFKGVGGKWKREGVGRWVWDSAEIWIEFKLDLSHDAFIPTPTTDEEEAKTLDHDTEKALETQGQLALYATRQLARQHRTFAISLLICGSHARFIRWDRSRAVVSERFNYVEQPRILAEFFWRYGQLTDVQRGFDPTARLATKEEAELLAEKIKEHAKRKGRKIPDIEKNTLSAYYQPHVITVAGVTPTEESLTREYVVQRPLHPPESPIGRSTRVYFAVDTVSQELVCLKDYWRPIDNNRPPESEIYKILRDAGVPHLPTVRHSGDVLLDSSGAVFQETLSQEWLADYLSRIGQTPDQPSSGEDETEELGSGDENVAVDDMAKEVEDMGGVVEEDEAGSSDVDAEESDDDDEEEDDEEDDEEDEEEDEEDEEEDEGDQKELDDKKQKEADIESKNKELPAKLKLCLSTNFRTYRHHRVVQDLLYPLSTGKSSKELVKAIRNAVKCLKSAHAAGVMHRDVSSGNVMVDKNGNGVLNDWDHALVIEETRIAASRRTGTWQFLSVALGMNIAKVHDILDDLESCYWVLLYQALHHFKSSESTRDSLKMFDEYKERVLPGGIYVCTGGDQKYLYLNLSTKQVCFECATLNDVIQALTGQFETYYTACKKPNSKKFVNLRKRLLRKPGVSMLAVLNSALRNGEWPPKDALPDLFPRISAHSEEKFIDAAHRTTEASATLASVGLGRSKEGPLQSPTAPTAGPSRSSGRVTRSITKRSLDVEAANDVSGSPVVTGDSARSKRRKVEPEVPTNTAARSHTRSNGGTRYSRRTGRK
ncbi:hypothetical protein BXZ70DRAFT_1008731 [Cristinia sonorae]|uniref:Fungal-type protein kinase domain-containing protein n=1 Tax=Cristinia sonorae TaxID=1940300 RepID=A0A8K0XP07_9AGAR|nr:hypothetical protein BXZ70DRAFT_1008731 [Cristinia sonorae]